MRHDEKNAHDGELFFTFVRIRFIACILVSETSLRGFFCFGSVTATSDGLLLVTGGALLS